MEMTTTTPLTVSPSTVSWLSCLKKFDTLAVKRQYSGFKGQSPVLRFGTLCHDILARLYDPTMPLPVPRMEKLELYINQALCRAPYKNDLERELDRNRARRIIQAYVDAQDMAEDEATIAVERSGVYPVKVAGQVAYHVSARLDRILAFEGKIVAVDVKLGARLPEPEQNFINLAVLKCLYPDFPRYEFWIESLSDDGVERTVIRGEDMKGAIHLLTARVQRYLGAEEPCAEPGEGCVWCPLRATCQGETQAVEADWLADF